MRLSSYISQLKEVNLCELLGISQQEFDMLNRSPLYHYKDADGTITEFFIYVDPLNSSKILRKIKRLKNNFIVFKPKEIFELEKKEC